MNTIELASKHPKAFDALPEPYQADSCLEFYESNGRVFARPCVDQLSILGNWTAMFNGDHWTTNWKF